MKKIKLTKGKYALVDNVDFKYLSQFNWFALKDKNSYYAARSIRQGHKVFKELMHRVIMNTPKNLEVDHKNGNKLDNRRQNLRNCTKMQNIHNRDKSIRNTSGYKGVNWHKLSKKWICRITINGDRIYLGSFKNKKDAGTAYKIAAKKFHKEFSFKGE